MSRPAVSCWPKSLASIVAVSLLVAHLTTGGVQAQTLQPSGNYDGANFHGLDFSGQDGTSASFFFSDVSSANFTGTLLGNTNFAGANMAGAIFTNAYLSGASLTNSKASQLISAAGLRGAANVTSVNLNSNNMAGYDLHGVNFTGAAFNGTTLSSADLSGATLNFASLRNATLSGANLSGVVLNTSTDFFGADLSNANLNSADLSNHDFASTNLHGATFTGSNLSGANLGNSDASLLISAAGLRGASNVTSVNLSGSSMAGYDVHGVNFTGSAINGATLSSANLSGTTLSSASLRNSNLSGADLTNAVLNASTDFFGADLSNANLSGLDLSNNTNFIYVNFSGANLSSANLRGTGMGGSTFTNTNLDHAQLPSSMPSLPVIGGATVVVDASLYVSGASVANSSGNLLLAATGSLTTSSLSLNSGAHLTLQLNGVVAGTSYGQIDGTDSINLNADAGTGATLDLLLGYVPSVGDLFFPIVNSTGSAMAGMFNGLPDDSIVDVTSTANGHIYALEISYDGNAQGNSPTGGHDLAVEVVGEVPEPGSAGLLVAGAVLLAGRRRRV
jgi:uncharacterized protein YjbI with pentapeptide repeats